uniref:L-serine ammonia-lyase n=1 Tax=Panagrolaimus sp. ES5 TaxID=591445 RepID=A0AC34GSH9_9BILA
MKKNVAILAGGYCNEAAVKAAACVERYLDKDIYNPYIIILSSNGWKYDDIEIDKADFSIIVEGKKINFDVAYNCVHGKIGEDGCISGYFNIIGIPYTGCNTVTSALTFNKSYCNNVVASLGVIEVAKSVTIDEKTEGYLDEITSKKLKYPLIVKPATAGGSFGISKVTTEDELKPAIEKAFEESSQVLIEEFIEGRELTCGVYKISQKLIVLPITEIKSEKGFFDNEEKHNPTKSKTIKCTPAEISEDLTKKIQETASIIYEKLGCTSVVRFDLILEDETEKIFFLEVNTIPGFWNDQSFLMQQVLKSGINLTEFFGMLIEDAIERHEKVRDEDSLYDIENGIMEKIKKTVKQIQKEIIRTPCLISDYYSNLFGMKVYLKKENQQITGSFKARGALTVLKNLSKSDRSNGIIAASTGNHALALAYNCMKMDVPLTIVVPKCTSDLMKSMGKAYGASLVEFGYGYKEIPDVDAILVPSGGGILAGTKFVVKNINSNIKVIGIKADQHEPDKDEPFTLPSNFIAVHINGSLIHDIVKSQVDELISVDPDLVAFTMMEILEHEHLMVEPPAILGLAALRSGKLDYLKGKKVAVVLTGGNVDQPKFEAARNRTLFLQGKLTTISTLQINIREISYGYGSKQNINLVLELRDQVQNLELQYLLAQKYKHFDIKFPKRIPFGLPQF